MGLVSCADAERATAALRALAGHSPPARSAMARSGSQMSAARSPRPGGICGRAVRMEWECSATNWAHAWRRAEGSRSRSRAQTSSVDLRFIWMRMQRSARVSGRWPMAAMALGHQVEKWRSPDFTFSIFDWPKFGFPSFSTEHKEELGDEEEEGSLATRMTKAVGRV